MGFRLSMKIWSLHEKNCMLMMRMTTVGLPQNWLGMLTKPLAKYRSRLKAYRIPVSLIQANLIFAIKLISCVLEFLYFQIQHVAAQPSQACPKSPQASLVLAVLVVAVVVVQCYQSHQAGPKSRQSSLVVVVVAAVVAVLRYQSQQ